LTNLFIGRCQYDLRQKGANNDPLTEILRSSARRLIAQAVEADDFQEALAALLGKDAPNISTAVIARLKSEWAR
jgi:hypothetical protein